MNKLIDLGNRFAAQSDWKDYALTKFCLMAMGIFIGSFIPSGKSKPARAISAGVFGLTFAVLMSKVLAVAKAMRSE